MKNTALPEAYARLSTLLTEDKVHLDPSVGFADICRRAGADPRAMDQLVRDELGMPGEDLVRLCHENGVPVAVVPGPTAFASALAVLLLV